jgi:hypothetical protein
MVSLREGTQFVDNVSRFSKWRTVVVRTYHATHEMPLGKDLLQDATGASIVGFQSRPITERVPKWFGSDDDGDSLGDASSWRLSHETERVEEWQRNISKYPS